MTQSFLDNQSCFPAFQARGAVAGSLTPWRAASRCLLFIWTALAVWALCAPSPASAQRAIINNLQAPQSIITDPGRGYFVANANGEPGDEANHAFISRLDQEGTIIDRRFIADGKEHAVLHSPTGMALVGDLLFVADIDTVRGFSRLTGVPQVTVPMAGYQCHSLTGLAANARGHLFVSDTETNAIYRIDPQHEFAVSLVVQDEALSGPRGLAVHPHKDQLTGVSWEGGKIFQVSDDGAVHELLANSFFSRRFQNLDGIAFDQYGSMYVSDMTAGKVWRILANLKKQVIAEFLVSPAGIGIDRDNHLIMVPYLYANGAEINGLELPSNSGKKKKPRDLSDYGLGWMKKENAK